MSSGRVDTPSSSTPATDADGQPQELTRTKKIIRPAREKHPLVARCEYILFLLLFSLLRALPFRVAFRFGEFIGWLFYVCDRPHRRVGLINLAIAFPEKSEGERHAILRESLRNLGRLIAEFCHSHTLTPETIAERVSFTDFAQWQAAVTKAKETGALVLAGHFGNWELSAHSHACYGFPLHIIHRRLRNPLIDDLVVRERERCGTKVIRKTTAGIEVLRAIRKKALVVAAIDQNASGRLGVFVPFFARLASTSSGLAGLALASGVPVIPAFLVREQGTWRHRIVLLPAVEPVRTGNQEADLLATTAKFSSVFQSMVEQYPEQWLWIHKRWKRRPEGEAPIY